MRYLNINLTGLELPNGWQDTSTQITGALIAANGPEQRSDIIDGNQTQWKLVKPLLAGLFNHKCWYTEAPQQGTDVDIDHYRPKKRVQETIKGGHPHSGYWWLAFNLENYRYSCIVANRRRTDVESGITGGKADHFPLTDEATRAYTPACDMEIEQPLLLDPLKATDVQLLTFKADGEAMPRYSEGAYPRRFLRADKSIELYNLNHSDFVRFRLKLRDDIDTDITSAKRYFKKLETGDADNDHAYEEAILRLRKVRSIESPFSSFCVSYLDTFKHKSEYEGVLDGVYL